MKSEMVLQINTLCVCCVGKAVRYFEICLVQAECIPGMKAFLFSLINWQSVTFITGIILLLLSFIRNGEIRDWRQFVSFGVEVRLSWSLSCFCLRLNYKDTPTGGMPLTLD